MRNLKTIILWMKIWASAILGSLLLLFLHIGGDFHHVGAFLLLFFHGGGLFWARPHPYENFSGRPWMKTIHYPNNIKSHLVTIVPMAPFTPKSTSKLRSALHFRYSIVIARVISHANTTQS